MRRSVWRTKEVSCTHFSTDLSRLELEQFDAEIEEETLAGTQEFDWTFGTALGSVSGGTLCSGRVRRVV